MCDLKSIDWSTYGTFLVCFYSLVSIAKWMLNSRYTNKCVAAFHQYIIKNWEIKDKVTNQQLME